VAHPGMVAVASLKHPCVIWREINSLYIYTQYAYTFSMKATFVEMTTFSNYRADYLSDESFRDLQLELLANPRKGDTISGTGGLRKVRWADKKRGKGKRGGTRIIYYFYDRGDQFWLFLIYDKDEMTDLDGKQKKAFKMALVNEVNARQLS
jgi:hypothetical protein